MDSLIGFTREDGVAFRIFAGPPVVMNSAVMRIGRVADVMAEDSGVVDDPLLDPFALVRIALGAPKAELDAQALKQLEDSERAKAGGRGLSPGFDQFGRELVAVGGVEGGGRNEFEIDEMIGRGSRIKSLVQVGLGAVTPAVRLGIEVAELIDRIAEKLRRLFRKFHRRSASRQFVAMLAPALRVVSSEGQRGDQ